MDVIGCEAGVGHRIARSVPTARELKESTKGIRFDRSFGYDFQSFGVNDLEMVDPDFASWNRIAAWLKSIAVVAGGSKADPALTNV